MTWIVPADILDTEVKAYFWSTPDEEYTANLVYFDMADAKLKRIAATLGVAVEDIPATATPETRELLEVFVCREVAMRQKGINPQHQADGQTHDMWADKYETYSERFQALLGEFDKLMLLGQPEPDTSIPNPGPTFRLVRA